MILKNLHQTKMNDSPSKTKDIQSKILPPTEDMQEDTNVDNVPDANNNDMDNPLLMIPAVSNQLIVHDANDYNNGQIQSKVSHRKTWLISHLSFFLYEFILQHSRKRDRYRGIIPRWE